MYPAQAKDYPDHVTVSIGAFIKDNKVSSDSFSTTVLSLADASCVFAKFSGKDKVVKIDLR